MPTVRRTWPANSSADAKSLLCTTCGGEVSSINAPGNLAGTRSARELLERWETEEMLDPFQPGRRIRIQEAATADTGIDLSDHPDKPADAPHRRIDPGHTEPSDATDAQPALDTPQEPRVARRPTRRNFRLDAAHAQADEPAVPPPHESPDIPVSVAGRIDGTHDHTPAPHFNISSAFEKKRHPGRGETIWGQLLAYAGVGVLTVGTGLVVWGYFGGPDSYTPTGWLLATAGQMLLFLGVVTLISGGMEQTTHEVTQRIEQLGDHIIRIERHTADQTLRGPHFATSEARQPRQAEELAADV